MGSRKRLIPQCSEQKNQQSFPRGRGQDTGYYLEAVIRHRNLTPHRLVFGGILGIIECMRLFLASRITTIN